MRKIQGFSRGMGFGGWLTNYKRFNVLPQAWRGPLTIGDMEHFASYITEADVKNVKEMGLDHVRVGFDQVVLEEAPYVYRETIFVLLDNFVSWCKKYGLNVVFNLHKAVGNYCDIEETEKLLDNEELQQRFIALWLKIEERFHTEEGVMFELLNELRDVDAAPWNALVKKTIERIRKVNPTRRIIVGGTHWNDPDHLKDIAVYDDENVFYTFHNYAPNEFTHQRGVLQAPQCYYNRVMHYPSDIEPYRDYQRTVFNAKNPYANRERMDKQFLYRSMQGAKDFIDAHPDKILWCGEFGTIRHADMQSRENWMRDMISICKEYDIPYCVWNYLSTPNDGNRFSLVDDETRKILSPALLSIIQGNVEE